MIVPKRVLLGWLRAIGRRHSRSLLLPVIPGYAELFPGSAEKIRFFAYGNFSTID